jgi:molybdate/tungstate transport system substrate-binding protein
MARDRQHLVDAPPRTPERPHLGLTILHEVPATKRILAPALASAIAVAGCGSSSSPAKTGSSSPAPTTGKVNTGHGSVDVLFAGSLVNLMNNTIGPAFDSATGFKLQGFSAGSSALAAQIKGKVRRGDVFISASPKVNNSLEGAANGEWVSWYVKFAASPLLLGYNPKSAFAHDLQTMPWYDVITRSGFLLGRTDPATDPKGALSVEALRDTATAKGISRLATLAAGTSGVYPEETLVGRLEAGQLDAGFFYSSEARAAGIPTVPLAGVSLEATYTITILRGAPDQAGAEAFVAWLLGPSGRAALITAGFHLIAPLKVTGSGLPPSLSSVVAG